MSRRLWIVGLILFVFLLVSATIIFFLARQKSFSPGQYLTYNDYSGEWQPTDKRPITNGTQESNSNGFNNDRVLRGFFDHYDKETDLLYMKAAIPFAGEQLYEVKTMKVGLQQSFYCTQSEITDEKTGETKSTFLYRFPVRDGQTLYTYFEKPLSLEDFFAKAKRETWIFVQLTNPYSETQDNYLYKLVAVGLCE